MTIRRLPSGDVIRVDTIDRVSFRERITNEDAFRASIRYDLLSDTTKAHIPLEKALECDVRWSDGMTETYWGQDADAIHTWAAALPLIADGGAA